MSDPNEMSMEELKAFHTAFEKRLADAAELKLKEETETRLQTGASELFEKMKAECGETKTTKSGAEKFQYNSEKIEQTLQFYAMEIMKMKDAPKPAAAGAKKTPKSKFKTTEICQKKLMRGFNDGECGAICAKNQKDKIIFSQCPEDATASGLCGKHHKQNVSDGGLRCGRCDTEDFNGLTKETFGTDEFIDAQVKGHIQWVKGVIHNLQK